MRIALGASAVAAVSIMAAGLVRLPLPAGEAIVADAVSVETLSTARPEVRIKHRVRYIQLRRGQKAPRGARVISGAVPTPRVIVTRLPGRPATTRRVVRHTRQSGG